MKTKSIILIAILFAACSAKKDYYLVKTDKSLQAEFDNFDSYTFASHAKSPNTDFVMKDIDLKEDIREAISDEMMAKGYEKKENADLLVNFRVFEEDFEMIGFETVYRDENYWGPNELRREIIGIEPDAEVRGPDDVETYQLEKGTIFVDMVNKNTGEVVWRGYASGILENNNEKNEVQIRTAIEQLFDEYQWRGDKIG